MPPLPADLHTHPDWSIDGSGRPREYCERALALGLPGVAFAPHFYLIPANFEKFGFVKRRGERVPVRSPWIGEYLAECAALKEEYAGRLIVLAGLEVDYAPEVEAEVEAFLAARPVDFVVGAVHSVEGLDIMIPAEMAELHATLGPRAFLERYFALLAGMARWGRVDTLAHLFGYLRCDQARHSPPGDLPPGALERLFDAMAASGVSLEVSSALLRQTGWGMNPPREVLERARACGVATYTFASDAHRPEDVGYRVEEAAALAEAAGLTPRPLPSARG